MRTKESSSISFRFWTRFQLRHQRGCFSWVRLFGDSWGNCDFFHYFFVSDAAHRMHPLAGQGVNLGFGDIVTLDALLGESVYSGQELGKKYVFS